MELEVYLAKTMPELNDAQKSRFIRYYELLAEHNGRVNLTAITDSESVCEKHFADSLLASELIPAGADCVDVGTGAGFPGIPLMIVRGDIGMKPRYATHSGRHFVGDGSVEKRHDRFFHEIDSDLIKTIIYI